MRRILLELSFTIALTLAAIFSSAAGARASDIMVTGAFARASATPVAKSGAAYVSIMNHGIITDRLLAITTAAARSAELHSTVMDGDMMKMEPVEQVDLPPGGTLEMKPGGLHIMLIGLVAPLKQDGEIQLTLRFEKAGDVTVKVPVGEVAAGSHDHTPDTSSD